MHDSRQCLLAILKLSICAQLTETCDAKSWSDTEWCAYYKNKNNTLKGRNKTNEDLSYKNWYVFDGGNTFPGGMITSKNVQKLRQKSPDLWGWHTCRRTSKTFFMETTKCLSDTLNTSWLKGQEFTSNVDQTVSTEMSECCSIQISVPHTYPCCQWPLWVWSGRPRWSIVTVSIAAPQSCYSQKALPDLNN